MLLTMHAFTMHAHRALCQFVCFDASVSVCIRSSGGRCVAPSPASAIAPFPYLTIWTFVYFILLGVRDMPVPKCSFKPLQFETLLTLVVLLCVCAVCYLNAAIFRFHMLWPLVHTRFNLGPHGSDSGRGHRRFRPFSFTHVP